MSGISTYQPAGWLSNDSLGLAAGDVKAYRSAVLADVRKQELTEVKKDKSLKEFTGWLCCTLHLVAQQAVPGKAQVLKRLELLNEPVYKHTSQRTTCNHLRVYEF